MGDSGSVGTAVGAAAGAAPTVIRAMGIMPIPGQTGTPEFDGNNVTDFLDH